MPTPYTNLFVEYYFPNQYLLAIVRIIDSKTTEFSWFHPLYFLNTLSGENTFSRTSEYRLSARRSPIQPPALADTSAPRGFSSRVLVLNQSYEPISVCNVKRALILLLLTKAELIAEREQRRVHSVSTSFPYPSIIRLVAYIHLPYKKIELSRRNIIRRDNGRCQYCGTTRPPLTVDHVMPKSRGGKETWENLVCACIKCNNRKGNRTPEEARIKLSRTPRKPTHVTFIKDFGGAIDEKWKPYLFF